MPVLYELCKVVHARALQVAQEHTAHGRGRVSTEVAAKKSEVSAVGATERAQAGVSTLQSAVQRPTWFVPKPAFHSAWGFQRAWRDRASPPHRPREDGLAHPVDTSRSNLAAAWLGFPWLSNPTPPPCWQVRVVSFDLDDTLWNTTGVVLGANEVLQSWFESEGNGWFESGHLQATMKAIRKERLDADATYVVSYAALREAGMVRMALQVSPLGRVGCTR